MIENVKLYCYTEWILIPRSVQILSMNFELQKEELFAAMRNHDFSSFFSRDDLVI